MSDQDVAHPFYKTCLCATGERLSRERVVDVGSFLRPRDDVAEAVPALNQRESADQDPRAPSIITLDHHWSFWNGCLIPVKKPGCEAY